MIQGRRRSMFKRTSALLFAIALSLPLQLIKPSVAHAASLNGHEVILDGSGKILPWTGPGGYTEVMERAWDFLLNDVPTGSNGLKLYYSYSYVKPDNLTPANWPHNPGSFNATLTDSALAYSAYSGDPAPAALARQLLDYHLAHGMTPAGWHWSNVPYASGDPGATEYRGSHFGDADGTGDGFGVVAPDKIGEMGVAFIKMYQYTGDVRYRTAAINAANALAGHVRTGDATRSPWPFRVYAETNVVREEYTAHTIAPIKLFDELVRLGLGNVAAYQSARQAAWTWMMTYPMQNNVWANYFEDVSIKNNRSNYNQLVALEAARYLLEHPEFDPNWEAHVRGILSWVESTFGAQEHGATKIAEQMVFYHHMGSHTSRFASINAMLYAKTGDTAAKEKAYRSFNWATYMARADGRVIDGPSVGNMWWTDGYGDYIKHFMAGIGAVPEWADDQSRLLKSTSVVRSTAYSPTGISYQTFDASARETLKLTGPPSGVTAGGVPLQQRSNLTAPGWTYDSATRVLQVFHDNSGQVHVALDGQAGSPPTVSITRPANNANFAPGANIAIEATAGDDSGVGWVEFFANGNSLGTDSSSPYALTWSGAPEGNHNLTARATDTNGATTTSAPVAITVGSAQPTNLPSPWQSSDIGSVGRTGSATHSNGVFTVAGSGADIWGGADAFHFAYRTLNGDGEIRARVTGIQNTHEWAKAGVMIRETLTPGSKHANLFLSPGHGINFEYRAGTNGSSDWASEASANAPVWLRLTRAGNNITAARSSDGQSWTNMGTRTITMAGSVHVGLAVTAHNNSVANTSTFEGVNVGTPPDTSAPVISNVGSSNITVGDVSITWDTNEPGDSQVDYGKTTAYGSMTTLNTALETDHTAALTGLEPGTLYHYRVKSRDGAGHLATSGDHTFTTASPSDTQAPGAPTNLVADRVTLDQVDLSWTAATDNIGVTGYQVWRSDVQIGTTTNTAFTDTTVAPATSYAYTVRAVDGAGNVGPASNQVNVITGAPVQPGGLVAAYNFDAGTGTTLADRSGLDNSGTISGATWSDNGRYGKALQFDGSNDMVTIADSVSLDLTDGMTLEAWVRPTSESGWRTVLLKEQPDGLAYGMYSSNNSNQPPSLYGHISSDVAAIGDDRLPMSTWCHLAGTFDGQTLRLYVDGDLVATRSLAGDLRTSNTPLRIGGNQVWGEYFRGTVDDVRIYDRPLSQSEIQSDMSTPIS
ncbi:MAG: LamG-like jellyroll fold domain-containing protein [Actinomycetota bacterium]